MSCIAEWDLLIYCMHNARAPLLPTDTAHTAVQQLQHSEKYGLEATHWSKYTDGT